MKGGVAICSSNGSYSKKERGGGGAREPQVALEGLWGYWLIYRKISENVGYSAYQKISSTSSEMMKKNHEKKRDRGPFGGTKLGGVYTPLPLPKINLGGV